MSSGLHRFWDMLCMTADSCGSSFRVQRAGLRSTPSWGYYSSMTERQAQKIACAIADEFFSWLDEQIPIPACSCQKCSGQGFWNLGTRNKPRLRFCSCPAGKARKARAGRLIVDLDRPRPAELGYPGAPDDIPLI